MGLLTRPQMLMAFQCSDYELSRFVRQGMPHLGKGKDMQFDLKLCQAWYSGKLDGIQSGLK